MFSFLTNSFSSIFSRLAKKGIVTESDIQDALQKVKEAFIEADVPYALVIAFCDEIAKEVIGQKVITSLKPAEQLINVVHTKLKEFLGAKESIPFQFQLPSMVMVMGLQGSGKTTTIAKLAYWARTQAEQRTKQRRIVCASVDYYRPAAIDQLEILAHQVGVDFYRAQSNDAIIAATEIAQYAQKNQYELVFLDTAGRIQIDQQMMEELKIIDTQIKPKHKLLVLDAMTGQISLSVAKEFEHAVGFQAAILTKMDSDTRAGAAFAFRYALKKPIIFGGTGEKKDNLEQFHPERIAGRILGMGDLQSLLEKAQNTIKESESQRLYQSMNKGQFTLQDFAQQLEMMNSLGSFSQLLAYVPGLSSNKMSPEMVEKAEKELKSFKAIISSMTKKERIIPKIIDGSRKKRIAQGAGVSVSQVNLLLDRFEQSQQYVKLLKKFGRFPGLFK